MALIMAAAVKFPEFNRIFSAVTYYMPPTNKQPEPRTFNRKNSLNEGYYAYDGLLAEKTGWTGDAGHTYAAAAKRGDRTLVIALMSSPDSAARWEDATLLLDYGFNEFAPAGFAAEEFTKENFSAAFANGAEAEMRLIPESGFNCLILKSMDKKDIKISYAFYADDEVTGKAVFSVGPGAPMYGALGEVGLSVYMEAGPYETTRPESRQSGAPPASGQGGENEGESAVLAALERIYAIISVILQVVGAAAVVIVIYLVRRYTVAQRLKKLRRPPGSRRSYK